MNKFKASFRKLYWFMDIPVDKFGNELSNGHVVQLLQEVASHSAGDLGRFVKLTWPEDTCEIYINGVTVLNVPLSKILKV